MTKVPKVIPVRSPSIISNNSASVRESLVTDLKKAWEDYRSSNLKKSENVELARYLAEGYSLLTRQKGDYKFLGLKKADLEIYQRIILGINNLRLFDLKDDETAFWVGKGLSGIDGIVRDGGIQSRRPEETRTTVTNLLNASGDMVIVTENYLLIGIPKKVVLEKNIEFDPEKERFVLNGPILLSDFSEVIYKRDDYKEYFQKQSNRGQPIFTDRTKERVLSYSDLEVEHISGILPYVFNDDVRNEMQTILNRRSSEATHGLVGYAFRLIDLGADVKHGLLVPNELLFLIGALNPISGETLSDELSQEVKKLIDDINLHEILDGKGELTLDDGVQACKIQANSLLAKLTKARQKFESVNFTQDSGYVQFSVETAICESRKNDLDEGKYVGELLGINPEVIKPGMKFVYHRGEDGKESSIESFSIYNMNHNSGNSLSSEGIAEMLTSRRESMLDKYRIYYAGTGFPNDTKDKESLRYLAHQIGHDVWFASLTNDQRKEFIRLLKETILDYRSRNSNDVFLNQGRSFDEYEEGILLGDQSKFESVSEAFALAFGRHVGFPILSDGRPFYYYIHDQKSDEIFKPFFDSLQARTVTSSQPSCLDFIHRIQKQIGSARILLRNFTETYYQIEEGDKNFKPLNEYVLSRIIYDLFMHGPNAEINDVVKEYIKLSHTREFEQLMSIILNVAEESVA